MSLLNVTIYYVICYYSHSVTEILLWTPLVSPVLGSLLKIIPTMSTKCSVGYWLSLLQSEGESSQGMRVNSGHRDC